MKKYNFMTIGCDCTPAYALKDLNLREQSLPFDWITSNVDALYKCFKNNFIDFHTELKYTISKKRVVDAYGFQYPHDYPVINEIDPIDQEPKEIIIPDLSDYYDTVKEKYDRRIKRFLDIVHDPLPLIILCRYKMSDVFIIHFLLYKFYNKRNVIFINSTDEILDDTPFIKNCYTEKNGIWNETAIWKQKIDEVIGALA